MLRFLSTFGASAAIATVGLAWAQQDRPVDPAKPITPNSPSQQEQPAQPNRPADRTGTGQDGPGVEHRHLESLVGEWQITGQCFEKSGDPNTKTAKIDENKETKLTKTDVPKDSTGKPIPAMSEPEAFSGTDHSEWILGGRFVRCEIKGTLGSKAMNGIAMTGYDSAKGRYVSTWQDDQCNSIKMEEGTYDPAARTFTFTGESTGPNGESMKCRRVVKVTSRDEHTMVTYVTSGSQPEKRVAEMTFRRTNQAARGNTPVTP